MRMMLVAAVAALALGFTVKDMTTQSGEGPEAAWEARAAEVDTYLSDNPLTGDTHEKLTAAGKDLKDWLLTRVQQKSQ